MWQFRNKEILNLLKNMLAYKQFLESHYSLAVNVTQHDKMSGYKH